MESRKLFVPAVVCLVATAIVLGLWVLPSSAAPPKFVKLEVVGLWGSPVGEESIDGGEVDETIVKALQERLKLKQLEVIDTAHFTGHGATWYCKFGEDNDNLKDKRLMLEAHFNGRQEKCLNMGLVVKAGEATVLQRNLVLEYDKPRVEFQKAGDGFLIFVLTASPW